MTVIDIKFESAKKNASDLADILQQMINILDSLDEKVNSMRWSGSSANRFKTSIKNVKDELDITYKNQVLPIPTKINNSVKKYQMHEN